MKTISILFVAVVGLALAFPSPCFIANCPPGGRKRQAPVDSQPSSDSNWPGVSFDFTLKFSNLNKYYAHLTKSYVNPEILTTYFNLPAEEQQCIENFYESMQNNSENYQNYTEDQMLAQIKAACPGSDAVIDQLNTLIKAEIQKYVQKYQDFVNSMPQSIKNAEAGLKNALTTLFQNGNYKDPVALQQTLVPALQAFQQIPPADVQALANSYPIMAPILTGAQSTAIPTLIQANIDLINTGKVANEDEVKQAVSTLWAYFKSVLGTTLYEVDHATEAQLPANVDAALKQKIARDLAKSFNQLAQIPFLNVNIDEVNDVYTITA
jgi:hypothetical protein